MLSNKEREQILTALHIWAANAQQGTIGFLRLTDYLTPIQVVKEVIENTEEGEAILEILEHAVRREGMDRVVTRLSKPTVMRKGKINE